MIERMSIVFSMLFLLSEKLLYLIGVLYIYISKDIAIKSYIFPIIKR